MMRDIVIKRDELEKSCHFTINGNSTSGSNWISNYRTTVPTYEM